MPGAHWTTLGSALRRCGSSLPVVFDRPAQGDRYEINARAIRVFYDDRGFWPRSRSTDPEESRLGRALNALRRHRYDLCDKYGIPRKGDRSEANRRRHNRPQMSCVDVLVLLCQHPTTTLWSANVGTVTGAMLNNVLKNAANPSKRGGSRGVGSPENLPMLCQVNSLARLKAERDADCWRLWLDDPAGAPDPRPWADILAAGDNVRVVKAARVAFLDWVNPDENARDWSDVPQRKSIATRRPWEQAEWPDLRAEPAAKPKRKART